MEMNEYQTLWKQSVLDSARKELDRQRFGPYDEPSGTYSLFEDSNWYQKGNAAFRRKPCEGCNGTVMRVVPSGPRTDQETEVVPCPSCHGWGVTPIDGQIVTGDSGGVMYPLPIEDSEQVLVLRIDKDGGNLMSFDPDWVKKWRWRIYRRWVRFQIWMRR